MKNRIIALILTLTTLFSVCAVTANAAREEEFLSEVALVYEDTVEEARAAIAGTDWKLWEQDLNPKADYMIDDGVYLIYKTSTNVEDAITDLRVMDMYGGFSISSYERQLEKSRDEYKKNVKEIRTIAAEFKALYDAGDEMAKLAYRQMNYYKDVKTKDGTETDMLMGDFFLNLPSDELKIVQVLLEGNSLVVSNLFSLLAIGLSNSSNSLDKRVADKYAVRDTLTSEEYHNDALVLEKHVKEVAAKIKRYDALKDKYSLEDGNMTEEEYQFVMEVGAVATLAESIKLGDVTFAEMLRTDKWTLTDLYPLVAAFSEGQMSLIKMGTFELLLKHASPSTSIEDLTKLVEEIEAKRIEKDGSLKPIDVYIGVDREIFKGAFAMTGAAERQQALTGETWDFGSALGSSVDFYIAAGVLAFADVIAWGGFAISKATSPTLLKFFRLGDMVKEVWKPVDLGPGITKFGAQVQKVTPYWEWNPPGVWFWSAVAIALIVVGLVSISTWYNYYNPDYTEIPNTMIDVRETDLGDKYIKYTAAKVYGDEDGRNADLNAYEGKEWIALYYTKDATAGSCLTPKFVYNDSDSIIARRHQGISMFGETEAFNLNSHVYSKNAPGVYVTMRYSTAEKAAADIPDVVGSMIATGALYTLTALGGAGVGVGSTILIQNLKKKRKKSENEATPEAN